MTGISRVYERYIQRYVKKMYRQTENMYRVHIEGIYN